MGYVANPRPGSGFPPQHTLTSLGTLRERGTVDIDHGVMPPSGGLNGEDETLGIFGVVRRAGRRAMARKMAAQDPRRSLALRRMRVSRRGGDTAARARQLAQTRRARTSARRSRTDVSRRRRGGIFGRLRARGRAAADRARAAQAEQAAREAAQIAEAERLARESVRPPPTVTDRGGWGTGRPCPPTPPTREPGWICRSGRWINTRRPPTIHPPPIRIHRPPTVMYAPCPPATKPPDKPGGVWQCIRGRWSFQGISTTMPVVTNGAPAPQIPTVRPWWLERPTPGDADPAGRDTSGIPAPPGLPGGPSMRPPASRDTATEIVAPEAPAAGMDMAKILPLVAGAALLFLNK